MSERKRKRASIRTSVGPGLHLGQAKLQSDGSYVVRLTSGEKVTARLDPDIPPSFVEECMRSGRRLLLSDDIRGAVIVGALERPNDRRADTVQIEADKSLQLRVGKHSITLEASGVARVSSKQLVVDAAGLVQFLTAKVELP